MKEFIFPSIKRGEVISAVYKMVFDDGSYYIGSCRNLWQRMWGWKFKLSNGIAKNYKVSLAFRKTNKVVFEVIEIIDDPILRRFREDGYIKINFGKSMFLNIASNAYTNRGVKQNPNRKINTKNYKSVAKVNDSGQIIERYESVMEANSKNNTADVGECFKNSFRKVKGMIFRELDIDGNIIPAKIPPPKEKKPRRKGYTYTVSAESKERRRIRIEQQKKDGTFKYPLHTKKVIKLTKDGQEIEIFQSIIEAAKKAGCNDRKNFSKIVSLKKSATGYYKGFIYRYA